MKVEADGKSVANWTRVFGRDGAFSAAWLDFPRELESFYWLIIEEVLDVVTEDGVEVLLVGEEFLDVVDPVDGDVSGEITEKICFGRISFNSCFMSGNFFRTSLARMTHV